MKSGNGHHGHKMLLLRNSMTVVQSPDPFPTLLGLVKGTRSLSTVSCTVAELTAIILL